MWMFETMREFPLNIRFTPNGPFHPIIESKMNAIVLYFALLFIICNCANALKVLFVAPLYRVNVSHHNFCTQIAKALTHKHEVHFLVPILERDLQKPDEHYGKLKVNYYWLQNEQLRQDLLSKRSHHYSDVYVELANNHAKMNELRDKKFHVGITEVSIFTNYVFPLFYWLNIPRTIAAHSYSLEPGLLNTLGLANQALQMNIPPVYYGATNTKLGDHNDAFRQRSARKAEIASVYAKAIHRRPGGTRDLEDRAASAYTAAFHPEKGAFPGIEGLVKQTSALLLNSQPELEFTEEFAEFLKADGRIKFVGGIHMQGQQLEGEEDEPKEGAEKTETELLLEKVSQKDAIVMISFGTFFDTKARLGETNFNAIKATIKAMPNRFFFWQLTKGDERIEQLRLDPEMAHNLHVAHWLEIPTILKHMRAKGEAKQHMFMSHCGRNSNLEAIFYGIPLICIPIHGDQFYNTEALVRKEYAVALDFLDFSPWPKPPRDVLSQEALTGAIEHKFDAQKVRELSDQIRIGVRGAKEVISRTVDEIGRELLGGH